MSRKATIPGRIGWSGLLAFFLCAFIFFSTFSIAGTQTFLSLALVLWFLLIIYGRAPRPRRSPLDVPILLFLAASLVAVIFSDSRVESLVNLKNLLLMSIIYLFGNLLERKSDGRRFFAVLICSGAASSIYGIVIFLLGRGEGTLGRTPGPFSTAMTFGGVLLLLCSIFVSTGIGKGITRGLRVAILAATLLSALALFLSFTRSSWVGMLASCIVILSLLRRRWLAPFAAGVVVFVFLLPQPYRQRITSIWDPSYRTNVQRLELLKGGLAIFKDHPWVGVGTMDLANVYERYMPPGAVYVHGHMHNIFLQVAVTTGIIGLAAFCFLIYSFFRLLAGNLRLDLPPPERAWVVGSLGAVTGFLVNGLFEWNFGDAEVVMLLYLVIGSNLGISMNRKGFTVPAADPPA